MKVKARQAFYHTQTGAVRRGQELTVSDKLSKDLGDLVEVIPEKKKQSTKAR